MNFIKGNRLDVISQVFENSCNIEFREKINHSENIVSQLEEIEGVKVEFLVKK